MNKKNDGEPKRSILHYQPLPETAYQGVREQMDPGAALENQDHDAAPLTSPPPHPQFESEVVETIPTLYHYQYNDTMVQRMDMATDEYEFPVLSDEFENRGASSSDSTLFQNVEDFENPDVATSSTTMRRQKQTRKTSVHLDRNHMGTSLRKSQESTPEKVSRTPTSVLKQEADARRISLDTLRRERKAERARVNAASARALAGQGETTSVLTKSDLQSEAIPAKSVPETVPKNISEQRKRITQKELKQMAEAQNISIDQVRRNRQNQQARAIRAKNSAKEERESSEQEATFRRNRVRYNKLSTMNQLKMDTMTVDKDMLERRRVELFEKLSSKYERELLVMLEKGNRLVAMFPSEFPLAIDQSMRKENKNLREEYKKGKLEFEAKQMELRVEQQIEFAKLLNVMDKH